ncbi:hypothetical protein SAMN05421783_11160 [Thiocapsa roseopersicina]|uniref:Uncharacterized protein n=1 Tax=Thiocapsa roseopersicina TaxID=1058 RepID=A0A1H2XQR7_THIRO|nr:hypothetical protein SAMN05421783_11160 [Thiocapsa roseopersicina]
MDEMCRSDRSIAGVAKDLPRQWRTAYDLEDDLR